jgi:hypothetical protein
MTTFFDALEAWVEHGITETAFPLHLRAHRIDCRTRLLLSDMKSERIYLDYVASHASVSHDVYIAQTQHMHMKIHSPIDRWTG